MTPRQLLFIFLIAMAFCFGQPDAARSAGDSAKGKGLYQQYCMVCHGPRGKGDGEMLFNPPASDLTSSTVLKTPEARLLRSIHEGRPNTAMGAWKWVLSEQETRDVLAYVQSLSR